MRKLLLLALIAPAAALANGYDVPNVNPRDLGLAGSGVAAQIDAAATYANPSALSRVEGLDVNGAISGLFLGTTWNGPSSSTTSPELVGQTAHTKSAPVPPFSIFAAYGFKLGGRNAGVGLGANIPAGGNVFWENGWPGRGRIITVDRKVYGTYLTAGYEAIPNLRVGGGLVYYYCTEYLKQGVQPFPEGFAELSTSGGALSFDLAAEYRLPNIPLTIGADFKYQGKMHLSGDAHFSIPPGVGAASDPPLIDQGVKHELTYPSVLNVGLSYQLNKPWLFTFGFTWNDYSAYKEDVFVGDKGTTIAVPRHYDDGYTFRLGAEYALKDNLQLRAGVLRDISGVNTDFLSPTLPDSSAWAGSLGATWAVMPNLKLNTAVFYASLDKQSATNTDETGAFPGSYTSGVWIISVGATWRTDLGGGGQ